MSREDRTNGIILASIDVFSRTNYEKATTAMLAREAGVAEGTLYKHFHSKKELFLACCRYIEDQLISRYGAIYDDYRADPLESLKGVAQAYLDFVKENPSMRKFLAFVLNNSFDGDFLAELTRFIDLNRQATERMIARAMELGQIDRGMDPKVMAWFFVGGYFTLILMTEMGEEAIRDPDFMDRYMDALFTPPRRSPAEDRARGGEGRGSARPSS